MNADTLQQCFEDLDKILSDRFCHSDLQRVSWYSPQWLKNTLNNALHEFNRRCQRWRDLYKDADLQLITHFRYAKDKQQIATITANDGTELLRLTYRETADIWRINQGLTRSQEKGFKLDTTSGEWVSKEQDRPTDALDNNVPIPIPNSSF